MKKILYISAVFSVALFLGSCKKFLTEEPLTQVSAKNYFKSLKDVNAAMAGVYGSFQQVMTGTGANFSGKYHYWGEARSDNFDLHPGYNNITMQELSLNNLTSGNAQSSWAELYRTIGRANTAIKYIPQAASLDNQITPAIRDKNLAECYAMRAMCYFYIIRLWGDAPIWTEPYDDFTKEDERPREPKDKIMKEIILADLEKAYSLTQKLQTPNVWLIGEAGIAAIAADAYMWNAGANNQPQDYQNAIMWIKRVFAAKAPSGKIYGGNEITDLESQADWKPKLFLDPTTSKEAIWSIYWDNLNNGCACIPVSIGESNTTIRLDSVIHNDWKFNKADTRVTKTLDTLKTLAHFDRLLKYYDVPASGFPGGGKPAKEYNVYLVMYRLGDVYLSYAEALNKTGDRAGALKYLNFIRVRAGLAALSADDPSVANEAIMEDTILQERRYELFGEGKRWFDLVRTNHVNKIMDPVINRRLTRLQGGIPATGGFGPLKEKLLWPINRFVLEDNRQLVQNPTYN